MSKAVPAPPARAKEAEIGGWPCDPESTMCIKIEEDTHTHSLNTNVTIYAVYLLLIPTTPPQLNFGKGTVNAFVKNELKAFQK